MLERILDYTALSHLFPSRLKLRFDKGKDKGIPGDKFKNSRDDEPKRNKGSIYDGNIYSVNDTGAIKVTYAGPPQLSLLHKQIVKDKRTWMSSRRSRIVIVVG